MGTLFSQLNSLFLLININFIILFWFFISVLKILNEICRNRFGTVSPRPPGTENFRETLQNSTTPTNRWTKLRVERKNHKNRQEVRTDQSKRTRKWRARQRQWRLHGGGEVALAPMAFPPDTEQDSLPLGCSVLVLREQNRAELSWNW